MIDKFTRRRLPHWDKADAAFFVTTCLDGSIPAQGLIELHRYRAELDGRAKPIATSLETTKNCCASSNMWSTIRSKQGWPRGRKIGSW